MSLEFIYFDLGNVLLGFDHQLMCRQMAEVSGIEARRVWQMIFETDLKQRYESGQLTTRQFYDAFCEQTGTAPDFKAFCHAGSAIFEMNVSMLPVVGQLKAAGYRLGLLSNTCAMHWDYCTSGRYAQIPDAFDAVALSFRIGSLKPDAKIFRAAADLAGVAPGEIFFADDLPGHVEAAREAGFHAARYTSTAKLVSELLARGVRFNY